MLVDAAEPISERKHWVDRYFARGNKYVGMFIPIVFFHTIWWTLAWRYDLLERFLTRWQMPLTMTVGATVAGMTSEGGGAVAFPVMTLLLGIDPIVARDFSLMIQSCGMTSATFAILWSSSIRLEKSAAILCSLGALIGCVIGLEFVEHLLSGPQKKMLFVSVWSSFGMALFLLNRERKRKTFAEIRHLSAWKVTALLATGFAGGICTSFAGSGADITAFSVLTLLFRINEKVATPTSVVIMATNTCVGFFWRHCIQTGIPAVAWEYW
ncbi:Protein F26A1.8 [Aphelenchoides avenae]|nr:Protein F26A1.8 [Aphelenchus avenae]